VADELVTVPLRVPVSVLAKVREAAAAVAPGKKGRISFSVDAYGNLRAGVGAKLGHVTVAAFAEKTPGSKPVAGGEVVIEWAPEP
jgi:hypothetical protein